MQKHRIQKHQYVPIEIGGGRRLGKPAALAVQFTVTVASAESSPF